MIALVGAVSHGMSGKPTTLPKTLLGYCVKSLAANAV